MQSSNDQQQVPVSSQEHHVPEIVEFESRESLRLEQELQVIDRQKKEEVACAALQREAFEAKERSVAEAELRAFEEQELPALLKDGERRRVTQLAAIDADTRSHLPSVAKFLIRAAIDGR